LIKLYNLLLNSGSDYIIGAAKNPIYFLFLLSCSFQAADAELREYPSLRLKSGTLTSDRAP
jgi:hypothetical protein